MAEQTIVSTERAPAAVGPYSQAVALEGLVFTSGQIALVPETGEMPEGIRAQTEQVMQNLGEVLKAAKSDYNKVLKTTCFLADMADFEAFNAVYARFFEQKPARSCVAARALPRGALVEVEAIAFR
ncbi:MAG: RidA family protein [Oscillospiraceae bacterium]